MTPDAPHPNPEGNRPALRAIREREVEDVLPFLAPGASVLEIGAGAGWQARIFAAHGHPIEAIDLPQSQYREAAEWPVTPYDGVHIPFPDASFDVIFSSNVLEHVERLDELMTEMRRVLKPGGIGIHLLPTSSWRIWATDSHYLLLVQRLLGRFRRARLPSPKGGAPEARSGTEGRPARGLARFFPPPHGVRGNFVTEAFWFSRARWLAHFRRHGWRVRQCLPNRIFYTRALTMWSGVRLELLRGLSRVLGSSCMIYVVEPEPTAPPEA